jgi:hypothetical protein
VPGRIGAPRPRTRVGPSSADNGGNPSCAELASVNLRRDVSDRVRRRGYRRLESSGDLRNRIRGVRPYFFTVHNEVGRCHVRVVDSSVRANRYGVTANRHPERSKVGAARSERWRTLRRDASAAENGRSTHCFSRVQRIAQPYIINMASAPLRSPGGRDGGASGAPACTPSVRDTHRLRMHNGGTKWQALQ